MCGSVAFYVPPSPRPPLCAYIYSHPGGFSDLDVDVDLVVEVDVDVDGAESPLLTLVDSWLYLSSLG